MTARSSPSVRRHSLRSSYSRRSTWCPWSGSRSQACASLTIKIPPFATLAASPASLPVSSGPAPDSSAAAISSTRPFDRTPSFRYAWPTATAVRDLPLPAGPVNTRFFHAGRLTAAPAFLRACSAFSTTTTTSS
jgi:hypothetical protein